MSQKFNLVALAAFLLSLGAFAKPAARVAAGGVFKDKTFAITLPKGWEQQKDVMGAVVVAISPQEGSKDTFRENINVVVENLTQQMTPKAYYEASFNILKKLFTDFKLEKKGTEKLAGKEFYWSVFGHKMGNIKAKVLQYMSVEGLKAYVITCSAAPEKFDKFKPVFEASVRSFKLGAPALSKK